MVAKAFHRLGCVLVLALSICGALPPTPALASCGGKDLVRELEASDPQAYAALVAEAAATPNTEAILWRVEKPGTKPSHLFGTAHVSDKRVTTLSPAASLAIDGARRVVFEVADLSPDSLAVAVARNASLFVFLDERRLDLLLGPAEFAKAAEALGKAGMPPEMAARIKPWLVFMMLAIPECERTRQSSGSQPLDIELTARARARGAEVAGLETIDSQLQALASIPEDQQVAMLKAVLFHADRSEDQMETVLQLYLRRQMGMAVPFQHLLARRAGIEAKAFAAFEQDIVHRRNAEMVTAALPLLAEGDTVLCVGALHLIGKTGLVARLREAGYTVTPVE